MKDEGAINKIKQTEHFMLMLWVFFLIVIYACSFLTEYYYQFESIKVAAGEKILNDLKGVFFFSLMGMGFLVDLVRMRENKNKAYIFLLLSLLLGSLSGGIGAIQYQAFNYIAGGG
jgi:hypothetical protein